MSLDVEINSKQYSLVPNREGTKISTRPVQQFVQPIRDTGRTRPEDVAAYESFVVPNLSHGFGRARINSDVAFDPKEYRRFFDSTCDTRWMDRIYLPILAEDSTQSSINVARASTSFKGELNLLGEETPVAGSTYVVNKQFSGGSDTWENGSNRTGATVGVVNPILTGYSSQTISGTSANNDAIVTYGDDRLLVVVTAGTHTSGGTIPDPQAGPTYGGVALTKSTSSTGNHHVGVWYLVNPALGSNTLSMTWYRTGPNTIDAGQYTVLTFQGVDQSTPISSAAVAAGTSTSASTTVTTAVADFVVSALTIDDSTPTIPDDHVTLRTSTSGDRSRTVTYEIATDSSTDMDYSWSGSKAFKNLTFIVNPSLASVGLDILPHKGNLVALTAHGQNQQAFTSSDSGATWTASTTQITASLLADAITANEDIDAGLLADIGGELIALVWDEDSGTITAFNSTNAGVAWTDESGFDIPSTNGPQGVAVYPDIDGSNKLYVGTAEGLYIVDTSPSTWTYELVMPMPHSTDNCRRMTIHEGSLWFAQGVDNSSPAPIYKLTVQGNSRIIEPGFGLSYGDGVPDDMLGPVKYMKSAGDQLFIAVGGGAASRNGRILAWNGFGWHSMYKNGTANEDMEWFDVASGDDGTPRLHFSERESSTASDLKFLEQPLVNPRSGVSIKREGDGQFIDLPFYDLGMPHESKNFLAAHVSADDLTASHETVEFHYGLNGAERDAFADLGDFTSAVSKLQFASGAGVSAKDIGITLKLNRNNSTNTNTPKIKDIIIEGAVVPSILYEHQMTIDIEQTAEDTGQSIETVISSIESLVESVIQTQFKFGAVSKYVTLDRERSGFSFGINSWDAGGAPNALAERTGTFNCVLVEKVAS